MADLLLHSAAQVVQQLLVDLGLGNLPVTTPTQPEWPVHHNNEPGSPNNVMTVTDTTPVEGRRDSFGNREIRRGVQIMVRGGTHSQGFPRAEAVADALDSLVHPRSVTVTYVAPAQQYCVSGVKVVGRVLRLGKVGNESREKYSINVLIKVRRWE
jgi:hypothetical protein